MSLSTVSPRSIVQETKMDDVLIKGGWQRETFIQVILGLTYVNPLTSTRLDMGIFDPNDHSPVNIRCLSNPVRNLTNITFVPVKGKEDTFDISLYSKPKMDFAPIWDTIPLEGARFKR